MATEAQIRANQENAKKSTGPRTQEGKARSAQNARIHGLCANTMLLTCKEEEDHYMNRCVEIDAQYAFDHALKQTLVTTIASAEIQINFINRMKKGVAIHMTDIAIDQLWGAEALPTDYVGRYEMLTRLVGIAFLRDASDKNAMGKFNRYEAEQHRIFHRAMMDLERLYDKWKDAPQAIGEPAEPVNETNPIPEPAVENKPDTSEPPATEPKKAAENPGTPSEAQGFSTGLIELANEKEPNPSAGPQNPDPLLPKAA